MVGSRSAWVVAVAAMLGCGGDAHSGDDNFVNVPAAGIGATAGTTMMMPVPTAGMPPPGGTGATGGMPAAGMGGAGGMGGIGGMGGAAGSGPVMENYGEGETGRMLGMTDAHNAVRSRSHTPEPSPPIPPLRWSTSLAATAQAYADKLATTCAFQHSMAPGLGENLAIFSGVAVDPVTVTESWAGEESCYTLGPFFQGDSCDMFCASLMNANGCGHYTQVVWRATTELGCGIGRCLSGAEIWVCNYTPPGNFVGMSAY